jgi:hypothetical protein
VLVSTVLITAVLTNRLLTSPLLTNRPPSRWANSARPITVPVNGPRAAKAMRPDLPG